MRAGLLPTKIKPKIPIPLRENLTGDDLQQYDKIISMHKKGQITAADMLKLLKDLQTAIEKEEATS